MKLIRTLAGVVSLFAFIGLVVSEVNFYSIEYMTNPELAVRYAQNAGNSGVVLMLCLGFLFVTSKKFQ